MPYIGNSPANTGNYQVVDDISASFNGTTTSFALTASNQAITPAKSGQLLVSINGVLQEPDDTGTNGFKVSSTNIVFSSAPAIGSTFWCVYQGQNVDIGTPSDGTVGNSQVADDALSGNKIDGGTISNFTSTGIDDNATTETLQVDNHVLKMTNNSAIQIQLAKATEFGYASWYRVLQLGSGGGGNNETLSLNYDPSGNPSASFSGTGNEVLMKNSTRFLTPNSANNGFHAVMDFVDGAVLKPNQPSASYTWSTHGFIGIFPANSILLNTGGHLATSGRFTAPITGNYLVTATWMNATNATTRVNVKKNGSNANEHLFGVSYNHTQIYDRGSISNIIPLNANDYLEVDARVGYGGIHEYHGNITFSLIG